VFDQLTDPLRVLDIGLAPGNVAQVLGVEQPALHVILEQVVDRPPVHPGGLDPDQRDPVAAQPIKQRQQRLRRGRKAARLLTATTLLVGDAYTRHD
jgi:hypothetical protein